jgi:hypothetical protein
MQRRWMYVVIALFSATLFAISVWIGQWWTVGLVSIGPLGGRNCYGSDCRPAGLAWIRGTELWERSAIATAAAGLIAMVLLMLLAGALAAQRVPRLLAKTTLVALVCAIVCAAYFIAKFPGVEGVAHGPGAVLYAVAIVMGAAAPLAVLRRYHRA